MKHRQLFPGWRAWALKGVLLCAGDALAAPGDEHWDPQFAWPGTTNSVLALAVNQGRVYAGGVYFTPGFSTNNFVEIWDGARWSYIPGITSPNLAAIYDFAFLGNELYVAGVFSRAGGVYAPGLARWNGIAWTNVGGFVGSVSALLTDGTNLYAGGGFTNAGGVLATNIAQWDGDQWSPLGAGLGIYDPMNSYVSKLVFHQGALYAGGRFTNSGPASVPYLARWQDGQWTAVGGGTDAEVSALSSGAGELFVGGSFTAVGTISARCIAKWNGAAWSPLGSGVNANVAAIGIAGGLVYVGGSFTNAGGVAARRFAVWNESTWSATGSGMNDNVTRIVVSGTNIYVGGLFTLADGFLVNHVGIWDGTRWTPLASANRRSGVGAGINAVRALACGADGVHAGGTFTGAGRIQANCIARFDGTNWWPLGGGVSGSRNGQGPLISAIALSGAEVYAGGIFTSAGGVPANSIARWDGNAWWPLGNGVAGSVSAIAIRGNEVFVGGTFQQAGNEIAFNVAKWDGAQWVSLPGTFFGTLNNFFVNAIAIAGANVYVGGSFRTVDHDTGAQATNIAYHDGTGWKVMGTGVNSNVNDIAIIGQDVYVGGRFTNAGGLAVGRIAKWNGANWSAMGGGLVSSGNYYVSALAAINEQLYVGGNFLAAGGVPANGIAKWDGAAWSPLGSGVTRNLSGTPYVSCLAICGDDLFAGGSFDNAGGKPSPIFARWNERINFDAQPFLQLLNPERLPSGAFRFNVSAGAVSGYIIDASTNLSHWVPIATNSFTEDPMAAQFPHRFYRAREGN